MHLLLIVYHNDTLWSSAIIKWLKVLQFTCKWSYYLDMYDKEKGLLKISYSEKPNDIVKSALMRQLKKLEKNAGLDDDKEKGD